MSIEERNELIEQNMKLVYYVIKRHYPTFFGDDDLAQVGMIGLIRAADVWDESRGKFMPLAYTCIRNEIRLELKRRYARGDMNGDTASLDAGVRDTDGDTTLADTMVGDHGVELSTLAVYGDCLTNREKFIVERFLLGTRFSDIARELGVSPSGISQSFRMACIKIKSAIDKANKEA